MSFSLPPQVVFRHLSFFPHERLHRIKLGGSNPRSGAFKATTTTMLRGNITGAETNTISLVNAIIERHKQRLAVFELNSRAELWTSLGTQFLDFVRVWAQEVVVYHSNSGVG
jgi:hypothetical protein